MTHRPYRIGLVSIAHESNTFVPGKTELAAFEKSLLLTGAPIVDAYGGGNHEMSGFYQALTEVGFEAVPLLFAHAPPGPIVSREAMESLWGLLEGELKKGAPFDGILVAPHGAGVSELARDMDGWWLGKLRERVGDAIPIHGTLDPHVNLSPAMLKATNALLAYRTNPHLDQKTRGREAAELMIRTVRGEIAPVQRFCAPPMSINIEKQHTEAPPLSALKALCEKEQETPGILDISIVLGFPYADVREFGSGILVVADKDAGLAEATARKLGWALWENRESYEATLIGPREAVHQAVEAEKPVLLLDMGDNVGGGAVGDATWLARLLLEEKATKTFCSILDPSVAEAAIEAGLGSDVRFEIAGRANPRLQGDPLIFEGTVVALPPSQFEEPNPRHGGKRFYYMGASALLQSNEGNLWVLVTSLKLASSSAGMFTVCGLEPADFDIIVAKGVNAPLGAFSEICRSVIRCNTPGTTSADPSGFCYEHRSRPLFPFEAAPVLTPSTLPVF